MTHAHTLPPPLPPSMKDIPACHTGPSASLGHTPRPLHHRPHDHGHRTLGRTIMPTAPSAARCAPAASPVTAMGSHAAAPRSHRAVPAASALLNDTAESAGNYNCWVVSRRICLENAMCDLSTPLCRGITRPHDHYCADACPLERISSRCSSFPWQSGRPHRHPLLPALSCSACRPPDDSPPTPSPSPFAPLCTCFLFTSPQAQDISLSRPLCEPPVHEELDVSCLFQIWCYTEEAEQAQQRPGTETTSNPGEGDCKKHCGADKTSPTSMMINRKTQKTQYPHTRLIWHRLRRTVSCGCLLLAWLVDICVGSSVGPRLLDLLHATPHA